MTFFFLTLPIGLCQPSSLLLRKKFSALMCYLRNNHTNHPMIVSDWGSSLILA